MRNVNVTVMNMMVILESEIVIQEFSSAFNLLQTLQKIEIHNKNIP